MLDGLGRSPASADGYIARPDGDLEWLTSRPAPEGFYGMDAFMRSIDTKVLGCTFAACARTDFLYRVRANGR
jgi:hypothetical protein